MNAASRLLAPGWNLQTRRSLEALIRKGSGQHLPVGFDFDNTIICGDIGEATLAMLARTGVLSPIGLPASFCPPLQVRGKNPVTIQSCADVTEYYEASLAPTAHGAKDRAPRANGYAWAVQAMQGLSLLEVIHATQSAFDLSRAGELPEIQVTPGKTGYPVPFFYPEMVELLAELLRHQFDVWVASASNVWSVRWMVLKALNPLLRSLGAPRGLRADHVIGISSLLKDGRGRLFKDSLLVQENRGYASLEPKTLAAFRLTAWLQFPVPTYSGKVACLHDSLGRSLYLSAGDSPGDHAMLTQSRHRLWVGRLERPEDQQATAKLLRRDAHGWMVQATLAKQAPGFLNGPDEMRARLGRVPAEIRASARWLSGWM